MNITKRYFSNLIEESAAISKAADVPFIEFFFLNNREVFDTAEAWDMKNAVTTDHCTVVVGFNNEKLVIGHNEDWAISAIESLVVLKVKINEISFIGLHYNGAIAGLAASMNNFGLVQCINDIYQTNRIGVPKNYIARAVLEVKSLDEAEKIIRSVQRASGFNHVLAQGNEVRNIEIAGDYIGIQKSINKPYVHTNHYLSEELIKFEKFHTKSSEARFLKATSLLSEYMTKQDIISILSDTSNKELPICREDETIGSAVFIPSELKANFCYGHPCAGEYVEYSL